MDIQSTGRWFMLIGALLLGMGFLLWLAGKLFSLENLAGTLSIQIGEATVYFPILLSVILSIVMTILLNLVTRILQR